MNGYGVDLARIHHEGHADLARRAGPAIWSHLRDAGIRRGQIVELGCGSGILARYLCDRGYQVLGVDPSSAMLRIASRVAPSARFVQKRAEDVTLPSCRAVIATGEALTYLPARIAPAVHMRRHIHRVSGALVPGGLFIFDAITEGGSTPMMHRTWRAVRDWAVLADVAEDRRRHIVTRRITTFTRVGSTYLGRTRSIGSACINPAESCASCGRAVLSHTRYSGMARRRRFLADRCSTRN
jgi:SAM-dependent methyltransferase